MSSLSTSSRESRPELSLVRGLTAPNMGWLIGRGLNKLIPKDGVELPFIPAQ